jgi:sugar/nucleoside kinase (ribokinase family)
MPAAPQLVCVGHLVRETIHFPDRTVGPLLGSPPAYCSLAAASQGTATAIVSRIGPELDAGLLAPLERAGIDLAGVHRGAISTTSELIYGPDGTKRIEYPTRAGPISAADVPAGFRGCSIIYVCTMDNDVPPQDIREVAALGRIAAVDLGGYGGVHMSRDRREQCLSLPALALGVAASFAIVKASDEDLVSIFGKDDPDSAAARLAERGAKVVVVTAVARGAHVYAAGVRTAVPAARARVVDTTGGGDSFMAGFLSEFLSSGDPVRAARWGCATAAFVIERTGGAALGRMPEHEEVRKRFAEEGSAWAT